MKLAYLWALLILILCALPGQYVPRLSFLDWLRPDKVTHLILFGVLAYLLIRGFQQQAETSVFFNHAKLYAVLISIGYGIFIELFQEYVTIIHRSGQVLDAVADAVGALFGLWAFNLIRKRRLS